MTVDPRLPHRMFGPHVGLAAMLVLEVAIGFLLFQLAWHAVSRWQTHAREDSGIAEHALLRVRPAGRVADAEEVSRLVAILSRLEGVASVSRTNQSPYDTESWNTQVKRHPHSADAIAVSTYFDDGGLVNTLGAEWVQGRGFHRGDYESLDTIWHQQRALPVIITRGLAVRLFGDAAVVGRTVYGPTRRMRIVGVVDKIPQPAGSASVGTRADSTVILPVVPQAPEWTRYLVRVKPGHDARQLATRIGTLMAMRYPARPASTPSLLADLRPATLRGERRTAMTLLACTAGWWLLTLLSLGAAGYLWVQRSWVRLSLHRALGASRSQIRQAVRLDHFWLVSCGLLLGALGTHWLLPQLPDTWRPDAPPLPAAWGVACAVLALTQLIATWPARRAASVTPHGVTRKPWVRL